MVAECLMDMVVENGAVVAEYLGHSPCQRPGSAKILAAFLTFKHVSSLHESSSQLNVSICNMLNCRLFSFSD